MKVALIGTHGVGKTTLCFELAARLKRRDVDVEMVREVARRCPLPINRETSTAAQGWILHTQMAWELEAEATTRSSSATARCSTTTATSYHAAGPQPSWEPLLAAWLPTYNVLIKVPLWTTPRWDGVRDTDLAFQRDIDALLDEQLQRRGLDALRLDVDERERWGDVVMAQARAAGPPAALAVPRRQHPLGTPQVERFDAPA